jgi:flagellar M-ring protein FliF
MPGGGAPPALAAPPTNQKLESARAFAQQNPAAVAQIVKEWVGGEPA